MYTWSKPLSMHCVSDNYQARIHIIFSQVHCYIIQIQNLSYQLHKMLMSSVPLVAHEMQKTECCSCSIGIGVLVPHPSVVGVYCLSYSSMRAGCRVGTEGRIGMVPLGGVLPLAWNSQIKRKENFIVRLLGPQ